MKRLLFAVATALALSAITVIAQTYPNRPVTIIVPFAAGGPTDVIARIVGEYYSKALGQQFVVENVAGAGGTTGITRGAQSKPDGYTIMMGHMGTHGAAPGLYANLKYDPTKDFEPLGLAAATPILIVARKDFPAANLKEFIAKLKDPAAKAKQAHAGVGSVSFTTCTLLTSQLGVKNIVVAYRGTGPAMNDLVGGQVDYMCDQIVNLVEQVKGGAIKAYAIAIPERSPALPDVPTTKEAGLPEFQVSAWNALFAPKGTPKEIVAKLNETLVKALDDGATRKRLLELGSVIPDKAGRSPEALANLVRSEVARWTPILKSADAVTYIMSQSGGKPADPATPGQRSGRQVVEAQCSKCHQAGKDGAPRIGDRAAWILHLREGFEVTVRNAIQGHRGMPARGGLPDLTDHEIRGAIVYMFNPDPVATK
jgi:tripartite-type tricarboxylate transporter receptor subunit TctC